MPKKQSQAPFNLERLKARIAAQKAKAAEEPSTPPNPQPKVPAEKFAELKKKYASILNKKTEPPRESYNIHPPQLKRGSFSQVERAALLRGVIDALCKRCNSDYNFKIWHKFGLSSLYFSDQSFLSYSSNGECIVGLAKKSRVAAIEDSVAYEVRRELKLANANRTPI
jgi:hypothetical protein